MISFKNFLYEMGGWSRAVTQSTKLTPDVAKRAISFLPQFERDFNVFLEKQNLAPIKIGKPVGSSAYIEKDLKENPNKEYGDIDVLMIIPRFEEMSESRNNLLYAEAVAKFVKLDHSYLYQDDENFGNSIIVKLGEDEYAQVDLVRTFGKVYDWAESRMTPEHGLKGALLGNLYTSFGELLNIGIGPNGIVAKEKDGFFVPYRTVKVDKHHVLSLDFKNFMLDILKVIAKQQGIDDPKVHPLLSKHSGMNKELIKAFDLANAIKGIGKSFEMNDMFSKGQLRSVKDYIDFTDQIKKIYLAKNAKAAGDAKFDKAITPDAKERAEATKDLLLNKSKVVASLLD